MSLALKSNKSNKWGPHWRDPLNGVKRNFKIRPTKLRISPTPDKNLWNISQKFEIFDGVEVDHLPSPNHSLIPNPPIPSKTYTFSGLATVTARISLKESKIHFVDRPSLSYTTGNYLGDGAEQIIQYILIKNG